MNRARTTNIRPRTDGRLPSGNCSIVRIVRLGRPRRRGKHGSNGFNESGESYSLNPLNPSDPCSPPRADSRCREPEVEKRDGCGVRIFRVAVL